MDESFLNPGRQKMEEVAKLVSEDLTSIQTGRAKPAMVEGIKLEAYEGSTMEIRELANITAPDPQTVMIKPWDISLIAKIAKAIQQSDLQVNPVVDNEIVRISVPSLTQERREELVKVVKQKVEAGKAMLRQVRIDLKKDIDHQKDQAGVSEDDIHNMYDSLQALIDEFNKKLEELEEKKEQELMAI